MNFARGGFDRRSAGRSVAMLRIGFQGVVGWGFMRRSVLPAAVLPAAGAGDAGGVFLVCAIHRAVAGLCEAGERGGAIHKP